MRRIDDDTVELTEAESLIAEVHANLVDAGLTCARALDLMTGALNPPTLRAEMPLLEATMSPDFAAWLRGTL